MWKHMVQPDRPHMTIRLMCFVSWITKATDTQSEQVIHIAFPGNKGYANEPRCNTRKLCLVILVEVSVQLIFLLFST